MKETEKQSITVNDLVNEIKNGITQKSSSNRDEIRIMRTMLNDDSFQVTTYSGDGQYESHCPATEFKNMISGIVSETTKISKSEAQTLVNDYEVKKSDAETMIGISKDFINTTLQTTRKIKLGGTERSDISIQLKEIPDSIKRYPKKVGTNSDGTIKYENAETCVAAHQGLKVTSPCPSWIMK